MNILRTRSTCRALRASSLLLVCSALGSLALSGCSGFGGSSTTWTSAPWASTSEPAQTAGERFGIKAPHQRMADLRELTRRVPSMSPAEQQSVGHTLAEQYRVEQDPLIRAQLVRTLAKFQTDEAAGVLREGLDDDSIDVRIAACYAWGARKGPEAVELLGERIASDANIDVRLAATRALGETGDADAVPKLGVALDDGDPALQYRAVLSLKKVTGKSFDNDVNQWRQYVNGETPTPAKPTSVAERLRNLF